MDIFASQKPPDNDTKCDGNQAVEPGTRDIEVQAVLSLVLGVSAFLAFCFLRPRWKTLYAARKRHLDPAIGLPQLPDSFFGWMPALYKITEEQVLACGGLDAFVFLSFFKMSMRLLFTMLFFAAAVLAPIHHYFGQEMGGSNATNSSPYLYSDPYTQRSASSSGPTMLYMAHQPFLPADNDTEPGDDNSWNPDMGFLWAYLVFIYFFTLLTIWFLNSETFKIIRIRQDYLGTQSTVTDRTFRLTGIPTDLRSEDKIRDLVEKLEIGKVESVTLCRDWAPLDRLVAHRQSVLSQLEASWAKYLTKAPEQHALNDDAARTRARASAAVADSGDVDEEAAAGENGRLLRDDEVGAHQYIERERPTTRLWYGFFGLQSRKTDAIDYYEEKLRQLDERIVVARKKKYEPADIAFVTMDSIAACQMATQALLDPRPGQLLTKLAPAPSDVVWHNTYAPRGIRRFRSWLITIFIGILSVVWLAPVAWLASLLSLCTIEKWWPSLSGWLRHHETIKALVQTGLPTIVVSALNVAVPFFYDYLSNKQGQLSQGEVELSIISKNFFFNFFNIFLVFTVFGTASNFWTVVNDNIRDLTLIASHLAREIVRLNVFYINFIMLQGLGLFPFRLLEFGSVFLYPFLKFAAKTPRERKLVDQPPVFSYGFYLPTALLVFILCLVYSVLPGGYLVLLLGVVYFTLGFYTYKYQLLYAMDAPRHATGGAWRIIARRCILGLLVAQVAMSGILALKKAFVTAALVVPLLAATIWYSYYFRRRFEPLTKYISLRSIRREEAAADEEAVADVDDPLHTTEGQGVLGRAEAVVGIRRRTRNVPWRRMSTVDEDRERGLRFVNPSFTVPLEQPWVYDDPPPIIPESQPSEPESDLEDRYDDGGGNNIFAEISPQPSSSRRTSAAPDQSQGGGGIASGGPPHGGSTSSSISLGDTHIWREG